jgi:hypothetical protein
VVIDGGIRHRLHAPTRTCAGCGQPWPCYVALLHRDPDAAPEPAPASPVLAVFAAALVLLAGMAWLAIWWLS